MSTRVRVEGEILIRRPVEEVFDFVADERNEPWYNPHMRRVEQLTPGAIGIGTRFRAEMVSMGRPVEMIIEWLARPMVARLGRRQEQRIWTGLKRLLEGKTAEVSA